MDFQQLCTDGSTAAAVTLHSLQHISSLFPIRLSLNSFLCTFSLSVFLDTTAGEKAPAQVGASGCCKVAVLIWQQETLPFPQLLHWTVKVSLQQKPQQTDMWTWDNISIIVTQKSCKFQHACAHLKPENMFWRLAVHQYFVRTPNKCKGVTFCPRQFPFYNSRKTQPSSEFLWGLLHFLGGWYDLASGSKPCYLLQKCTAFQRLLLAHYCRASERSKCWNKFKRLERRYLPQHWHSCAVAVNCAQSVPFLFKCVLIL